MDENQLSDWADVRRRLGALPSLRVLNLSSNPLPSLTATPTAADTAAASTSSPSSAPPQDEQQDAGQGAAEQEQAPFPKLEALYLASCQLGAWPDVDAINRLPALRDLRLTGNPLLAMAKGGGRFEVSPRALRRTCVGRGLLLRRGVAHCASSGAVEAHTAAFHTVAHNG